MTYTATELEKSFKKVARIRYGKQYANDAGYWTGGRCEWGGAHSLAEDCQTFANGFNKIDSLKNIKTELQKCTSKSEYDAKKNNYIRKCEEAINGLSAKTGSSYTFGVCIIWSDEASNEVVENKMKVVQQDLRSIKSTLQKEDYKWVQELKELDLEINQINQRMEENKKKAMKETDPVKKVALITQIEEDGLLLQQKYQKKKELSDKFKWDPKKKVDDLISAMKRAIERNQNKKSPNNGSGGNRNCNSNASESDSEFDDEDGDDDNNGNNPDRKKKNQPQNFFQENQQLILITGVALLFLFWFSSQKETPKSPPYSNYDF